MTRKYIHVKQYARSIGKRCMHCGRPATVVALDATDRTFRHRVRYCHEHAVELGAVERKEQDA